MIMQCPRCSTRWRVADTSATDNPIFKCGRCHHVFSQFPGALPAVERGKGPKARSAVPDPDNLEFIFPARGAAGPDDPSLSDAEDLITPLREAVAQVPSAASSPLDDTSAARTPQVPTPRAAPQDTPRAMLRGTPVVEEPPRADASSPTVGGGPTELEPPAADPRFDLNLADDDAADDDTVVADLAEMMPAAFGTLDVEAMMGTATRTAAFRPATRLLLGLVMLFALLALLVRANPQRADLWLARIPVFGAMLTAEPSLKGRITLDAIQGGYQRLRSGHRVFVISGKATNNALVPVERIEVEGALYAASGTIDRKVISTGNRTTLKLRDLSEPEIAFLQNLDARQPVSPGAQVDFAIVFLEPPRDLREFSSRVLTARSTGRAGTPPARPLVPSSVG